MAIKCLHDVKFSVQDLDTETFASDFGLVTSEKTDEHLFMKTRGECGILFVFQGDFGKAISSGWHSQPDDEANPRGGG